MGTNQQLRNEVIRLYRTVCFNRDYKLQLTFQLYYMGKEYPKGSLWFHERLKNAFARNKDVQDEQKIRDLIKRGEYVVKVCLNGILLITEF